MARNGESLTALQSDVAAQFRDCASVTRETLRIAPEVAQAADLILGSLRSGGKLITFGNGGSAADAQHLAAELVGRYRRDRAPFSGDRSNRRLVSVDGYRQ